MAVKDRHETDEETAFLLFRSNRGREYLDINLDIDCPDCPDDGEDFGVLEMEWKRTEGPYDTKGHDWVATCPKCGYHAVVSVHELGERKRRREVRV